MKNKNFKLFCKELDEIVSVKSFSHEDEAKLYDKLKNHLATVPSSYNVNEYKKTVVEQLLLDSSSYYTFFDKEVDAGLVGEIVNALYSSVIEAYPHFEFEFICNDINNMIAVEQMRSIFQSQLDRFGPEPKEKKVKKVKSFADITKLHQKLKREVIGQDEAAFKTIDAVKLIVADIDSFSSLFYIGPTGVGKSKLAKILGGSYSGNYFKVNCGEYSSPHDYAKLIGAPPGYVGHSDTSFLGEKAAESSAWVILFDEIEKASPKFYDFLLSLLDDGTCTDNMGSVLDFSKSIFIFTTNVGVQENRLGDQRVGFGKEDITYEENKDQILKSIKRQFNAEFLNRIDHFIFFNRLGDDSLREIAKLEMNHLPVLKSKSLLTYIIQHANHQEYGARNIAKFIKNNISTQIADAVLRKKLPLGSGRYYTFRVDADNLFISNIEEESDGRKNQKTSQSR